MRLFSKSKPKNTTRDAILQLRETLDVLDKREKYLTTRQDKEREVAKKHATRDRQVALQALKRSKMYDAELGKIRGMRMTMETQMSAIEDATFNFEAMKALQTGAQALKTIHGKLNIDDVDAIVDDIREQSDLANEISTAISQPIGIGAELDDDELNEELKRLEQEELDERLLGVEKTPVATTSAAAAVANKEPVAAQVPRPTAEGNQLEEDEEKELEMLRASMAM